MNISAKTEYACIAMIELSAQYEADDPVQIRRIADIYGIPSRFLVQILLQLKGAGLVTSSRGACGGYRLARSPDDITLAEVMAVIEGKSGEIGGNASKTTSVSKLLIGIWNEVAATMQERLQSITLSELIDELSRDSENMYHI